MKNKYLFLLFSIFFTACATQPYVTQSSAFIILKTPAMRYADQGFIYENQNEVKAEIYASGQVLFSIRITGNTVCTGTFSCLRRDVFNKQMLSSCYPEDTLEKIFRAQPVFGGKNMVKERNGFTQEFINGHKYHIEYSVLNNETVFRDTINHILIKIKRL